MYTLYRSLAAFYECLITVVIALLRAKADPQKFLYYHLTLCSFLTAANDAGRVVNVPQVEI